MKEFWRKASWEESAILLLCVFLFLPGFSTYFYQEDLIHFSHSQSFQQVVEAFNIFKKGEYPFYRPLSTQLYFYLGKTFFGFNPFPYHLVNFFFFSLNIILVSRLVRLLTKERISAGIASFIFAVNSTHVAPLFSAANIQEILFVFFGLLAVFNFLFWLKGCQRKNFYFRYFSFFSL